MPKRSEWVFFPPGLFSSSVLYNSALLMKKRLKTNLSIWELLGQQVTTVQVEFLYGVNGKKSLKTTPDIIKPIPSVLYDKNIARGTTDPD